MPLLETLLGHASLHDRASTAKKRAALKAKLTPAVETPKVFAKSLKLAEGDDRILDVARVEVKGNLVLDDQSRLLVAGDLVVAGNIIHEGFDYALLFVGGTLQARNLLFHGELVALGGITLRGVSWTYYNDYSTYTDTLTAKAVVADDRVDAVDAVKAPHHLSGHSSKLAGPLAKLLRPELLDQGTWDYPSLAKRLAKGEDLLR